MLDDPLSFIEYIRDDPDDFLRFLSQHVQLTLVSVLVAVALAVPAAILVSRVRPLARPMTWLASVGQTIPSLAVLGFLMPFLGIGFRPALVALTIQAFLPIFLNAYVGLRSIDRAVLDAARGMGTSGTQRLLLVEMPLASPVILAGIQTATVQNIAIATLAAYIGAGGLGDLILQGLSTLNGALLFAGAVPVALLAILAEVGLGRVRRAIVPVGLRPERGA